MHLSDLQNKDIVNIKDGKKIGNIVDVTIDNNGNKLFKNRVTHLVSLNWDERHTLQRELYELVTDYVSKTYNKALRNRKKNMCLIFLLIIMQRMVTSSTAAVRQSLERRLLALKTQSTYL